METLLIQIAEHHLKINCEHPDILNFIKSEYQSFIQHDPQTHPDIEICIEPCSGATTVDFKVDITVDQDTITYLRSDYKIKLNHELNQGKVYVLNDLALKHALMNLYSAFITHHSWGILLHSSCIEHGKKAHLFTGQSGAGKSTVARLSYPRPIWSDEATIVKVDKEKGIRIYNSPFRSELKTSVLRPGEFCELSGIYLLIQSQDVRTSLLPKSEAMLKLMDKVFNWPYQSSETKKAFHLCKQLIERVPVYHLYFQKNNTFWELIS